MLRSHLLHHVSINLSHRPAFSLCLRVLKAFLYFPDCLRRNALAVQHTRQSPEEDIVELDHICKASPVGVKTIIFHLIEMAPYLTVKKIPVRAAPPVDALLHITYYKVASSLGVAFQKERQEVVVLHTRGVLKLVQEEMIEPHAGLFIYERSVRAIDYVTKDFIGVIQTHYVLLLHYLLEHLLQLSCQSQSV